MNSKFNYIAVGVNCMVAVLGAVVHNLPAILMGVFLSVFYFYSGEHTRRLEDEKIRIAATTDKTED